MVNGAAGTVTNFGTILASVALSAGGIVNNFGTIAGFDLGLSNPTQTPQPLPPAEAAILFVADKNGEFTDSSQRLAYDTKTGQLFASSDGGVTKDLVAKLSQHPTIQTSQLFFIT